MLAKAELERYAALVNRKMHHARLQAPDLFRLWHQDLQQECWIGLWTAFETYRPDFGVPFTSYAALLMSRRMRRFLLKRGRESPYFRGSEDLCRLSVCYLEQPVEESEALEKVRQKFQAILSLAQEILDPDMYQIIYWRYAVPKELRKKYKEIAREMRRSVYWVKQKQETAILHLRKILQTHDLTGIALNL